MDNQTSSTGTEIPLSLLWRIFRKYWILLAIIAVVVGLGVGVLYAAVYTPEYSSSSQFYVSNISLGDEQYSSGQTAGAEDMAQNCAEYVSGSIVLRRILTEAGLQDSLTLEQLEKMISAEVVANSAVFTVEVTGPDPELNLRIANAVERVLPAYVDYFNAQSDEPVVGGDSQMVKLIDQSELDTTPNNSSNRIKYPLLACMLALVLGYVVLLIVSITDRTVYGKNDIKEKLPKAAVFGVIPHWEIETSEETSKAVRGKRRTRRKKFLRDHIEERLISREKVPFRISEAFQQLCTNVTFCSTGEKGCTIGVLSSLANSGKSFVMANLALSLSRLIGKKVLLVDADMRCPMQHRIFRLQNRFGLSNLLAGQSGDALHSMNNGALDVITSGTIPPNPMELLSGPRMTELLEQWKKSYDYILFDLPPLGEVSDAAAVAKLMSGYLFVLRSGLNDVQLVREAAAFVEDKEARIFGYVLTDVEDEYMDSYYGKYKYAKYAYYSSYRKEPQSSDEKTPV